MTHQSALRNRERIRRKRLGCVLLTMLALAPPAAASIEVNVTQIGFPTLRSGPVVRHGSWSFIMVDLALVGEPEFDGRLRVAQYDNDGDRCFDSVEVHLRADGGGSQRVFLYMLANLMRADQPLSVELLDEEDQAVEVVCQGVLTYRAEPPQAPSIIPDDDVLILSVSQNVVGRVRELVDTEGDAPPLQRSVHVAHIGPSALPPHWIGLEAVDYIIWDDARPEDLTDGQLAALLAWVRCGGTLLIAASRSAASLAMTESLRDVLPVDIGDVIAVEDLDVRYTLVGPVKEDEDETAGFPRPVPVAQVTLRGDAERVPNRLGEVSDAVTRRRWGRGSVIFSPITLRDLFSAPGSAVDYFREIFQLTEQRNPEAGPPTPISLFGSVAGAVSFSRSAGLYLLVVGIASIGYVLVATFGSWGFLKVRQWTQHSWSVFAILAIMASTATVVSVQSMRGFGESLHQLSIIDLDAGARFGDATVLFGLRAASDKRLDVWLPSDPLRADEPEASECFLRPLPGPNDLAARRSSFTDPSEYRIVPASAVVEDTRLRATLKLLEGRWSGPLQGSVTARVRVRDKRITEESNIMNQLGVDLHDCILLQPVAARGRIKIEGVPDVLCYAIGTLPSDGTEVNLAQRCYGLAGEEGVEKLMAGATLSKKQSDWSSGLQSILARAGFGTGGDFTGSAGQEYGALLLLSTIAEFDSATLGDASTAWMGRRTWSRDRLRSIDLAGQLTSGSIIVIGVADDPGPVRLFRREGDRPYRRLDPVAARSRTVYRIHIPTDAAGTAVAPPQPSMEKKRIKQRER